MNIIILSATKQQQGGVERFSYYLKSTMEARGHQVTILAKEDLNNLQRIVLRGKKIFGMEQPALGYFLGKIALHRGFDVCITNGMLGWNIKNKKIINVQHGTFARAADRIDKNRNTFKFLVKKYVWGFFEGFAARRASVCVAVSEETKESVEKYYRAKNVKVILNAVDTELFHPVNRIKKDQVVFVGRFEYAKGKEVLEGMQSYLTSKGLNLLVAEHLTQQELAVTYNESKVFLLPSLHEGCSYALLDAMACGLPFLASPVGLVPELVEQGLFPDCVVREQTLIAYIEAFESLMSKTDFEKQEIAAQLRSYILEKHSLESFSNAYYGIIESL